MQRIAHFPELSPYSEVEGLTPDLDPPLTASLCQPQVAEAPLQWAEIEERAGRGFLANGYQVRRDEIMSPTSSCHRS